MRIKRLLAISMVTLVAALHSSCASAEREGKDWWLRSEIVERGGPDADRIIAILDEAADRFVKDVVVPALKRPRGEPRVRALLEGWLAWSHADYMPGGCVFVASIAHLDRREGPVRERLVQSQRDWLDTLATAVQIAITEGHFRSDLDSRQVAHELLSLAYGHHLLARLLRDPGAER